LFASGPLTEVGAGPLGGGGLTVLRVASTDEAREIAEAEPFAKNGLRTFEIKEWTIMEGTLGLRVAQGPGAHAFAARYFGRPKPRPEKSPRRDAPAVVIDAIMKSRRSRRSSGLIDMTEVLTV
jgi:hypothetical protein